MKIERYKPIKKKTKKNWVTVYTTTIHKSDGSQAIADIQQEATSKEIRTVEV